MGVVEGLVAKYGVLERLQMKGIVVSPGLLSAVHLVGV